MITVVAALIEKEGKYLIARRSTGSEDVLGKWEFPGGKVEPGESEEHAIEREIKEEFEMDIKAIRYLTNNICEYPSKTIDLRLYECKYISGEFHLHDHSEYKFVDKERLLDYDLAEADISLAKYIKEM
ncbi:MAG: (deoxy)nucleoside triphosphate pyrophosphohydrolase [Bacilli bacterium]|nr:(deoxy)nucleoside triphosphate pyrophosphohydrolase [Bacilli bacterium]